MIQFTEEAAGRIRAFLEEDETAGLAVRVGVKSPSPVAPEYEMALIEPDERRPDDQIFTAEGFDVVVDPESARILDGTRIDWVDSMQGSGFKFENPNLKPLGAEPLEGPLADRVRQVIEERINPGVASHGGQVTLVDVRDNVVYLEMSGGCQGCGMAAVTLKQGIERMLREAVPEVEAIEDVTDHKAGTNPYF